MAKKINSTPKAAVPAAETAPAAKAKPAPKAAPKLKAKEISGNGASPAPIVAARKTPPPKPAPKTRTVLGATSKPSGGFLPPISQEDIALRAYFISEKRRQTGTPGDSAQDWLEAERQLHAERGASTLAKSRKPARSPSARKAGDLVHDRPAIKSWPRRYASDWPRSPIASFTPATPRCISKNLKPPRRPSSKSRAGCRRPWTRTWRIISSGAASTKRWRCWRRATSNSAPKEKDQISNPATAGPDSQITPTPGNRTAHP